MILYQALASNQQRYTADHRKGWRLDRKYIPKNRGGLAIVLLFAVAVAGSGYSSRTMYNRSWYRLLIHHVYPAADCPSCLSSAHARITSMGLRVLRDCV